MCEKLQLTTLMPFFYLFLFIIRFASGISNGSFGHARDSGRACDIRMRAASRTSRAAGALEKKWSGAGTLSWTTSARSFCQVFISFPFFSCRQAAKPVACFQLLLRTQICTIDCRVFFSLMCQPTSYINIIFISFHT